MAASVRVLLATVIVALLAGLVTANRNHAESRVRRQGVRQSAIAQQGNRTKLFHNNYCL